MPLVTGRPGRLAGYSVWMSIRPLPCLKWGSGTKRDVELGRGSPQSAGLCGCANCCGCLGEILICVLGHCRTLGKYAGCSIWTCIEQATCQTITVLRRKYYYVSHLEIVLNIYSFSINSNVCYMVFEKSHIITITRGYVLGVCLASCFGFVSILFCKHMWNIQKKKNTM